MTELQQTKDELYNEKRGNNVIVLFFQKYHDFIKGGPHSSNTTEIMKLFHKNTLITKVAFPGSAQWVLPGYAALVCYSNTPLANQVSEK